MRGRLKDLFWGGDALFLTRNKRLPTKFDLF